MDRATDTLPTGPGTESLRTSRSFARTGSPARRLRTCGLAGLLAMAGFAVRWSSAAPFTITDSTSLPPAVSLSGWEIAFGDGHFLASGPARVYLSNDGWNWTDTGASIRFNGMAFGGGTWVAAGDIASLYSSDATVSSWVRRTEGRVTPGFPANPFHAVAYGDGFFASVGTGGMIATSSDGITWGISTPGGGLWGVAFGEGRFVAVGQAGVLRVFTAPRRDILTAADIGNALYAVCHGPHGFVAVGSNGLRRRSTDGLTWDPTPADGFTGDLRGVAYGGGYYVAVGNQGAVIASADGRTWERVPSGVEYDLDNVAFGHWRFVVVGERGQILRSSLLDPGVLQLVQGRIAVAESGGTARLSVARMRGVFGQVQVRVTLRSETARAAEDFVGTPQLLTWQDGESQTKDVEVPIVDDSTPELSEVFDVVLSDFSRAEAGSTTTARVTILGPNDRPIVGDEVIPSILLHPVNLRAGQTEQARFEVLASGTDPLQYQWLKNGQPLSGETNDTLVIPSVRVNDGGAYSVVVGNRYGSATSDPANLEITLVPLGLADRFADRSLFETSSGLGSTDNLAASLEDDEPRHDGKRASGSMWMTWRAPETGRATFDTVGSTFDTLLAVYTGTSLVNLTELASDDDSGEFLTSRVVFNAVRGIDYQIAVAGFANASGRIVLGWNLDPTKAVLPRIVRQPRSQAVEHGGTAVFEAQADGVGLSYQWFFTNAPLSGATGSTLRIGPVGEAQAGDYRVLVTNADGESVNSGAALLEVVSTPETAVSQDKLEDLFPEIPPGSPSMHGPGGSAWISISVGITHVRDSKNDRARRSDGDPLILGELGGASLWLRLRVTHNGLLDLTTQGSDVLTVLGVYTNRIALSERASDRAQQPSVGAFVRIPAHAGVDYLVMVDGVDGARGRIRLKASLPVAVAEPWRPQPRFEGGRFLVQQAVPSGAYELRSGEDLFRLDRILRTNIHRGILEFADPRAPAVQSRFYELRALGRGTP